MQMLKSKAIYSALQEIHVLSVCAYSGIKPTTFRTAKAMLYQLKFYPHGIRFIWGPSVI